MCDPIAVWEGGSGGAGTVRGDGGDRTGGVDGRGFGGGTGDVCFGGGFGRGLVEGDVVEVVAGGKGGGLLVEILALEFDARRALRDGLVVERFLNVYTGRSMRRRLVVEWTGEVCS